MKSYIKTESIKLQDIKYPWIGQEKHSSQVVLFHKECCGTIIYSSNQDHIGFYDTEYDMNVYKPFKGTVSLHN